MKEKWDGSVAKDRALSIHGLKEEFGTGESGAAQVLYLQVCGYISFNVALVEISSIFWHGIMYTH